MQEFQGKKILIFQQRDWAKRIGHFLAKKMRDQGCEFSAVTLKKRTDEFIKLQKEIKYDYVINIDEIVDDPEKVLNGEKITLEEICSELNIDSVWPMLHSNRTMVRSYKDKFYYGYRQNVSDEFIISYVKAYYKSVRDLFQKFKPDLVLIVAFVSDEHMMLKLFADKYKIPVVAISDAKVPGYFVFAHDEMYKIGSLRDRFFELQKGEKSDNIEKAKKFIAEFREAFKKPIYGSEENEAKSLWKIIRHELSPYKQVFDWYTKKKSRANYLRNIGPTIDYKPPRILLRDFYAMKRYTKFIKNYKFYPFEKLGKFVFYPLKFTPEGNIDLMCPLYNNQIELGRQIAMSLPGDYTLAAKEHWAMLGLRNPSYLVKIDKTPNVKLIDYRIPVSEILNKTDLVISTYSTTFFEAAIYRKPVIMLSESGIFDLLPNVFPHTDLTTLSKKIKEVLAKNLNTEEYDKQLINYIAAVYDVGFNYNYAATWERGEGSLETLWDIYKKEFNRLLK